MVYYRDKDDFNRKVAGFALDGPSKLQVISDFDFTLSKFYRPDGDSRSFSCHKVLEDCGLLHSEYHEKAQALQKKYYPLEVDPSIDYDTRVGYMVEW
jgi:5'-nucleotidase